MIYCFGEKWGGPVKIGTSRNPIRRLQQVNTGSPYRLEILAMFPGEKEMEQALHRSLFMFRMNGEWFNDAHGFVKIAFDFTCTCSEGLKLPAFSATGGKDEISNQLFHELLKQNIIKADCERKANTIEQWLKELLDWSD